MLLALPPGALDQRLTASLAMDTVPVPSAVPVGLPADLLRRRADIRRSDADLHAATAQIGVATSQLFPGVTLGLFGGFQAQHMADLDEWASGAGAKRSSAHLSAFLFASADMARHTLCPYTSHVYASHITCPHPGHSFPLAWAACSSSSA